MSDDSFIREVDEELRSDRVQDLWKNYGKLLIGGAVAVVLGTAGYRYYDYHNQQQAAQAGDAYMQAVRLADEGKVDEAIAAFNELEADTSPVYKALSKLRSASELAKQGNVKDAVAAYDAIAADGTAEQNLRSIARLRAGILMVDEGSVADVESRVGQLMGPGAPYRGSAKEALALAQYKAGDLAQSAKLFTEIKDDAGSPRALAQRALLMLDLIASEGGPAVTQ